MHLLIYGNVIDTFTHLTSHYSAAQTLLKDNKDNTRPPPKKKKKKTERERDSSSIQ